jgi:hypothetical protein
VRCEIAFNRGPAGRVLYRRADLEQYLLDRRGDLPSYPTAE